MDVLEDYLDGKLDAKAMYQVEKFSLEDPFVAEALAGLSQSPRRSQSLSILQKQLQERIAQKPVEQKRWRITSQRLSIASAAAVLFITVSILFWLKGNKSQEELAKLPKKVEVNIAPQVAKDKTMVPQAPIVKDEVDKAFEQANRNQLAKNKAIDKAQKLAAPKAAVAQAMVDKGMVDKAMVETMQNQEMAAKTSELRPPHVVRAAQSDVPAAVLQGKVAGLSTTVRVKPKIGGVVLAKEDGLPLPGVKIQLLNKKEAVTTNAKGEFTLPIDSLNQTVVLSAIGFKTKEVNINAAKPNTIILEPAQNSLNEVVVTSYGTQKKQAVAASSTVLLPQAAPLNGWVAYQDYLKINNKFSTATPVGKTVELTFKIDRKGNPTNISITKSQGNVFDEEAIRLLKNGPKWIYDPNMVQGKLTINF